MDEIPLEITVILENAAMIYSDSRANTNVWVILRTLNKLIPIYFLIKLFANKLDAKDKV